MFFTIIENSTTTDPYSMNDNFLYVGQGSILPKRGINLDSTNGVCNLGNTATAWDNVYTDNLNIANEIYDDSGNTLLWTEIYSTIVSIGTSRIEIIGLNLNKFNSIDVFSTLITQEYGVVSLYPNGDSTSANYIQKYITWDNVLSVTTVAWTYAVNGFYLNQISLVTTTNQLSFGHSIIQVNSGLYRRTAKTHWSENVSGSLVKDFFDVTGMWSGAGTITSLVIIYPTISAQCYIGIWGHK